MVLGIVITLLFMVLVARAIRSRAARGEPMAQYALIWAVILAGAFAAAWLADHSGPVSALFT